MSRSITPGSTDQSTVLRFLNADGDPVDVDHATAGLSLWYRRDGGLKVSITPAPLASLNAPHTDGGVEPIDNGYVRVDLPDAAVAAGASEVLVGGSANGLTCVAASHPLKAGGDSAQEFWTYAERTLTQTPAEVANAVSGSTITIHRGDSFSRQITSLGSLADRSKLWFTVKRRLDDADDEALIQIIEGTGLTILNRSTAVTAGHGALTVTDQDAGDLTIVLDETATAQLAPAKAFTYDLQVLRSGGEVETVLSGTLSVTADVTRATA